MIKNFKISRNTYNINDITKALEKEYKNLEFSADDKKYIESKKPHDYWTVEFDIIKANTELANAFRSFVLDEIPWTRITCYMEDIQTDDPMATRMTDFIQGNIWTIPTSFVDNKELEEIKLEISVVSDPEITKVISSNDIKLVKGPKTFKWLSNIKLAEIEPGRYFKADLVVEKDINRKHATFAPFYSVLFRPLGFTDNRPPSYSVMPEDYHLGFSCINDVCDDPKWLVNYIWTCISDRLQIILTILEEFEPKSSKLPYISDLLKVSILPDQNIRYEFTNEVYAIGNIINKYTYLEDDTILFIACGDDHPEDQNTIIRIRHPTHAKLLIAGTQKAIKVIKNFSV